MTRKALIDSDVILHMLQKCKKCELFDRSCKLKYCSDKVWKKVAAKISVEEEKEIEDSINVSNESTISQEFEPHNNPNKMNTKLPQLYFDITLSEEQWWFHTCNIP